MQEDKVLDELFSVDEKDLLKTAKQKSTKKIVGISIGISLLVIFLLGTLKVQITPIILDKKSSEISYYYSLHGANIFLGDFSGKQKIINNQISATKYKVINNIPVYVGEESVPDNRYDHNLYMETGEIFTAEGHRVMQFFHPRIEYSMYKNDLARLNEFDKRDIIELGISLDSEYSFKEVKAMLPKEITLNWCWIDTEEKEITYSEDTIFEEETIMGFSTIDGDGKQRINPTEDFIESLELIIPKTKRYKEELKRITDKFSNGKEKISEEDIPVIGVVVVGRAKDLKLLEEIPEIKATSFGVILK